MIKQVVGGNLQVQALNTLVQVPPSKKYYTGAEVPFSSGKHKATRSKPIKMGEFLTLNRARKEHNNSSLTEHNASRETSQKQRRVGTTKDHMRGSSASFSERLHGADAFESYLRSKQDEKGNTDLDEIADVEVRKHPRLVAELDDPLAIAMAKRQAEEKSKLDNIVQEESDTEIKFPFSKKADKGKKVEFKKATEAKNQKGIVGSHRCCKIGWK